MKEIQHIISHRSQGVLGHELLPKFAILIPLVKIEDTWQVLFQERAHHLKRQPGEICFPGGRIEDTDVSEQAAAVRETCEELGLYEEDIDCFGALDYLVEPHRIIYPFAGTILQPERIKPNNDEVARLFYVPLNELKQFEPEVHLVDTLVRPKDNFPFEEIGGNRGTMWKRGGFQMYFYKFGEFTVWGLTALILKHFLDIISGEQQ